VKAPRSWPKSSFSQAFGMAAQFSAMKGARGGEKDDEWRAQIILSGAAFAEEQNVESVAATF